MIDRKDTVRRFALRLGRTLVAAASTGVLVVASCGEPQLTAEPSGSHLLPAAQTREANAR
jgi:hypothetical protein